MSLVLTQMLAQRCEMRDVGCLTSMPFFTSFRQLRWTSLKKSKRCQQMSRDVNRFQQMFKRCSTKDVRCVVLIWKLDIKAKRRDVRFYNCSKCEMSPSKKYVDFRTCSVVRQYFEHCTETRGVGKRSLSALNGVGIVSELFETRKVCNTWTTTKWILDHRRLFSYRFYFTLWRWARHGSPDRSYICTHRRWVTLCDPASLLQSFVTCTLIRLNYEAGRTTPVHIIVPSGENGDNDMALGSYVSLPTFNWQCLPVFGMISGRGGGASFCVPVSIDREISAFGQEGLIVFWFCTKHRKSQKQMIRSVIPLWDHVWINLQYSKRHLRNY